MKTRNLIQRSSSVTVLVDKVGIQRGIVSTVDRLVRRRIVPVASLYDDGLRADVAAGEIPVVKAQRAVVVVDVAEVGADALVIANLVSGVATQVAVEVAEALVVLFKDDDLGLDLAAQLGDDLFGHFLENRQSLLDDLDRLRMTHDSLGRVYRLMPVVAVEIVDTVERVEV